ncbi:hypothetical protein COCON_G00236400, partial [Conger conger]
MVDRTTRWPEAVPLSSTSASDVSRAFIGTWVARFGTPSDLSSDRGTQFTSELWTAVADGTALPAALPSAHPVSHTRRVGEVHIVGSEEPKTREDFLQYSCGLTLDPNTVHEELRLSEGNRE